MRIHSMHLTMVRGAGKEVGYSRRRREGAVGENLEEPGRLAARDLMVREEGRDDV